MDNPEFRAGAVASATNRKQRRAAKANRTAKAPILEMSFEEAARITATRPVWPAEVHPSEPDFFPTLWWMQQMPVHDRLVWAGYRALLRIATGEPEWALIALRMGITAGGDDLDALPESLLEPATDAIQDAAEALDRDPPNLAAAEAALRPWFDRHRDVAERLDPLEDEAPHICAACATAGPEAGEAVH